MNTIKRRLLLVDDEPEIVQMQKLFFSEKGYEVKSAHGGQEALEILEQGSVDLIILDIRMPGMSGDELARIVKDKYPQIKVIVLTGYAEEARKLAPDSMFDGLFMKPIKLNDLYSKLLDVLGGSEEEMLVTQPQQGIKARVLSINAKLLFIEPSDSTFSFLKNHFKGLFKKGENYLTEVARNPNEYFEKSISYNPDLTLVNISSLKSQEKEFLERINLSTHRPKEIIFYSIDQPEICGQSELDKLTHAVQAACFKNGLIEVKWVNI